MKVYFNMKNFLLIIMSLVLSGCLATNSYTVVPDKDMPNYMSEIGVQTNGSYTPNWVQPTNKTEKCEMLYEGYSTGESNFTVTWNGDCSNGKAVGIGEILENHGSIDVSEILYLEKGKGNQFFYKTVIDSNVIRYGRYIREDDKLTRMLVNYASQDANQNMQAYAILDENLKTGVKKGVFIKQYSDGTAKYTGIIGSKLFYGMRETFNDQKDRTYTQWGYYDVTTEEPSFYGVVKNKQGQILHLKYEHGSAKEKVQLPESYTNNLTNIANEGKQSYQLAQSSGQYALSMKEKYDKKYNTNNVVEKENKDKPKSNLISTGTGFFISNDGFLLTNSHVVENSSNVSIIFNGVEVVASVVARDSVNDIALLKIDIKTVGIPLEVSKKTLKGSEISILGYPNIGLQGNEQKATFGYINSNSGMKGDLRYYQMSAPIQAGNSGSPVLNNSGSVIGIATSTLNQSAVIKSTGNLAQNVNYAMKITYALPLLISNNVKYSKSKANKINKTNLIDKISNSVVLVVAQ